VLSARWRPRIKPEHGIYRASGDRVRLGGAVHGIAAEVVDATGAVWTMLNAADGSRSIDKIVDCVLAVHPDESRDAVVAALEQFADAGYLENAAADVPAGLSDRERERYARSRQFYRWIDLQRRENSWEPQLRLKTAHVVLLGLGGTGGTAAAALAASGVGRLHCIDGDVVELSNLNRQILFTEDDFGRPKADVTVERLLRLNSDIVVTGERAMVTSEADLGVVAKECDVFVLCADQPGEIRAWANRMCLESGTPWVEAGYHGPSVTASAYLPGRGPCYECCWLQEHEQHSAVIPDHRAYTVERGSSQAVSASSAGLSGHLAAHLAVGLITGIPEVIPGRLIGINLAAADPQILTTFARHPRCPACGDRP
jgi:molybdopterin/thiamine biosynthesis adenylyltransferase